MLVSIIIPCKDKKDKIEGLRADILSQKVSFDTEVIKIDNISPPGRARNVGAAQAKGEVLVFLDCDIRLGSDYFLENLIKYLLEDKSIGATCASIRIPPDSTGFQRRYAKEVAHSESPLVDRLTEVAVASSACFAIFRDLFFKSGGFNEDIIRGEDSVFSYQLIKAGYRLVLVPRTWCYHSQPANIIELIKTNFRNGLGVCFVDTFYPQLNLDVNPKGVTYFSDRKSIFERAQRFLLSSLEAIFQAKVILALVKFSYALAYFYGVFRYRILKCDGKNK